MSTFNLFVYGTLRSGGSSSAQMAGCDHLGAGQVRGTLYDIDGAHPAVVLYGDSPVRGEVWRCPADRLLMLDRFEGTAQGLFRRVAVEVEMDGADRLACWMYAAGPALSHKLTPERRVAAGSWSAGT